MSGEVALALTKRQKLALRLLARGGARYGTMIDEMRQLQAMGLARAHDTGKPSVGRWTWRPIDRAQAERLSK